MARLDRLASARELAQLGATLGREFSYDLIQAVSSLDEAALQQGLAQLVEAELIYRKGLPPQASYLFKHALVQDTAYQSLLKSQRQQFHQHIAQALAQQFPEVITTQPELLAHHYTEASLAEQAIPYWQQAGERAVQRSANVEAIGHFTTAIEVLQTLPDSPERSRQELSLQVALGVPLQVTTGVASAEVEQVYTRALVLCEQVGETPHLFPTLFGQWSVYNMRAEYEAAHETTKQLLSLVQRVDDPGLRLEADLATAFTLFWRGEFVSAREHFEAAMALSDLQKHRAHVTLYRRDPGVGCNSMAAWTLWLLGYPDQARERIRQAITLAQAPPHPYSLAYALAFAGSLHQHLKEGKATQERAEALISLCTEQGFAFFLAWGNILRGWALAAQGRAEEGIGQIRQGLAAYRATGARMGRSYLLALLGEAHGKAGQAEEGLATVAEALAFVDRVEERYHESDLYRVKGELILQSQTTNQRFKVEEDAEVCFQKAIENAKHQQAKSWELRASTSLARLWQGQGKQTEAHQLLSAIYNWFTEGFDTNDLQEAKALLEELR
jgi:predicted ATPase